jgi:acetylornithine deacetylase/succinyl-diaminopimelate desuccinylase-like protein
MSEVIFNRRWQELLLALLETDTQSPLETGHPPRLHEAQRLLSDHAREVGFEVAHFGPPADSDLTPDDVPFNVKEAAAAMGEEFTRSQPSLVLSAGTSQPQARTRVVNLHMDTVAGFWQPSFEGDRFVGRGAVDAKGPGVAALAGIAHALNAAPELLRDTRILLHSVAGEEGGAMGTYGTRTLIERGFVGRLNLFAEPSGGVYFDSATSTMTARVEVRGEDSTDDAPAQGDNATLILSFVCRSMAASLAGFFEASGRRMCVAGINTGAAHNRVYGSGALYLNFAYADVGTGREIEGLVGRAFRRAVEEFEDEFAASPLFSRSAANASAITRLRWLKRGLPTLQNRDSEMERLLAAAGLERCPPERADEAFTCDAIWAQGPGRYVVVYGPGELAANRAHANGEFVTVADLDTYAVRLASLVRGFAAAHSDRRL